MPEIRTSKQTRRPVREAFKKLQAERSDAGKGEEKATVSSLEKRIVALEDALAVLLKLR
jgi:hypothetical protein